MVVLVASGCPKIVVGYALLDWECHEALFHCLGSELHNLRSIHVVIATLMHTSVQAPHITEMSMGTMV